MEGVTAGAKSQLEQWEEKMEHSLTESIMKRSLQEFSLESMGNKIKAVANFIRISKVRVTSADKGLSHTIIRKPWVTRPTADSPRDTAVPAARRAGCRPGWNLLSGRAPPCAGPWMSQHRRPACRVSLRVFKEFQTVSILWQTPT